MNAKRILLIDDEEIFHFIHTRILNSIGIPNSQIITATNGTTGLELVADSRTSPSFIFVDLNMPGMNGFEFIKAVAQIDHGSIRRHIGILTSSDSNVDREAAKKLGVTHYFVKPLTEEKVRGFLATTNQPTPL